MTNQKNISAQDLRNYRLVKNRLINKWQTQFGIEVIADWLILGKMKRG